MIELAFGAGLVLQEMARWQPSMIQFVGHGQGKEVVVCLDGKTIKKTFAGKLVHRDRTSSWNSVCADVRSPVSAGQFFWVRPRMTTSLGRNVAFAGNIVAKHLTGAKTPDQCAGLQLAVWEAIEDGGLVADFGSGRFMAQANENALAWASSYYGAVASASTALLLQTTPNGNGQSQMMGVPRRESVDEDKR